jgi:hypothetical protein
MDAAERRGGKQWRTGGVAATDRTFGADAAVSRHDA